MVTPFNMGVMVIDEDPTSLFLIHTMLKTCHYRVESFGSPQYALNALRERRELFDLVITEVHMDSVDGFALLRHIVMQLGLPVITTCSDNDVNIRNRAIIEGACFHLVKPINMNNMEVVWQKAWKKKEKTPLPLTSSSVPAPMSIMNPFGLNFFEVGQSSNYEGKKKRGPKPKRAYRYKAKQVRDEKTRLLWDRELHHRFLVAIRLLGDETIPTSIYDLMNVEDLSVKQISSHLQKHRKRVSDDSNDDDEPPSDSEDRRISVYRQKKKYINICGKRPRLATSLPPGVAPLLGMTPIRINYKNAPSKPDQKNLGSGGAGNSTYPQNSILSNFEKTTNYGGGGGGGSGGIVLMGNTSPNLISMPPSPIKIGSLPPGNVGPATMKKNENPYDHFTTMDSFDGITTSDVEAFLGSDVEQPMLLEKEEKKKQEVSETEYDPVQEWLNLDSFFEIQDEQTHMNEKAIVTTASCVVVADELIKSFDAFLSIHDEESMIAGKENNSGGEEEEFLVDFDFSVEDCMLEDDGFLYSG